MMNMTASSLKNQGRGDSKLVLPPIDAHRHSAKPDRDRGELKKQNSMQPTNAQIKAAEKARSRREA